MAQKTQHAYELELRRLMKQRTGQDCDPWLVPQIRATAQNMCMIDKLQAELLKGSLVDIQTGSMGQMKTEVNPLLPYFDKMQRTLILQFEAYQNDLQRDFVKVSKGKVMVGGKEMVDLQNVPFAALNKEYQRLQKELAELDRLLVKNYGYMTNKECRDYLKNR